MAEVAKCPKCGKSIDETYEDTWCIKCGERLPVCFDCHAEIHSYNDRHPKGRKFTADELKGHKDQWLAICRDKPEVLLQAARDSDVGPLQAVLNELEFNLVVAKHPTQRGCLFKEVQFNRAISQGALWIIDDTLKGCINEAYAGMGRANQWLLAEVNQHPNAAITGRNTQQANTAFEEAAPKIRDAHEKLQSFMQPR